MVPPYLKTKDFPAARVKSASLPTPPPSPLPRLYRIKKELSLFISKYL